MTCLLTYTPLWDAEGREQVQTSFLAFKSPAFILATARVSDTTWKYQEGVTVKGQCHLFQSKFFSPLETIK